MSKVGGFHKRGERRNVIFESRSEDMYIIPISTVEEVMRHTHLLSLYSYILSPAGGLGKTRAQVNT